MKTFNKWTAILALVFLAGPYIRQLAPSTSGDIPLLNFIAQYDQNIGLILSAIYLANNAFCGQRNPLTPFFDNEGTKASRKNDTSLFSNIKFTLVEVHINQKVPRTPRKEDRSTTKE